MWRGRLSLRRVSQLAAHLPRESATYQALGGEHAKWTTEAVLLADLFHAWTGNPHPSLPKDTSKADRARDVTARLKAHRARLERK